MDGLAGFGAIQIYKRYAKPGLVNGQMVPGLEILNNGQPWTALMSIQPMVGYKVQLLPEGLRTREPIEIFTSAALIIADERTGVTGDRLFWNTILYEIFMRQNWGGTDLPHFRYTAVKVTFA